jgi:hypothetical protein
MGMKLEFNPVPKFKEKRPKKSKNPNLYRGRIIPTRKERTRIKETDYNRMIEEFGEYCQMCGHTPIEAHHIVFRAQFGSGHWRNLAPLCKKCHNQAHQDRNFADLLRDMRAERFGIHFWKDKYSLFKEGLINNTDDKTFESFMVNQEKTKISHHNNS